MLDDRKYVFKQVGRGQRGFELWDGMEMEKLVDRPPSAKLMPDLIVLAPVPAILVLLFPWLDGQALTYRHP